MHITFEPMHRLMQTENISYYRLANEGIDAQTLQRIRHDRPVTTETLGKLCAIMHCQPGDLIEYLEEENQIKKEAPDAIKRRGLLFELCQTEHQVTDALPEFRL